MKIYNNRALTDHPDARTLSGSPLISFAQLDVGDEFEMVYLNPSQREERWVKLSDTEAQEALGSYIDSMGRPLEVKTNMSGREVVRNVKPFNPSPTTTLDQSVDS